MILEIEMMMGQEQMDRGRKDGWFPKWLHVMKPLLVEDKIEQKRTEEIEHESKWREVLVGQHDQELAELRSMMVAMASDMGELKQLLKAQAQHGAPPEPAMARLAYTPAPAAAKAYKPTVHDMALCKKRTAVELRAAAVDDLVECYNIDQSVNTVIKTLPYMPKLVSSFFLPSKTRYDGCAIVGPVDTPTSAVRFVVGNINLNAAHYTVPLTEDDEEYSSGLGVELRYWEVTVRFLIREYDIPNFKVSLGMGDKGR